MAQFNYFNDINNALSMDGELTRGPAPRWQKKLDASTVSLNNSVNTSKPKLSISYNGFSMSASVAGQKTPNKICSDGQTKKTPNRKSPSRKSPSADGAKTPSGGDRFIPSRVTTNFELSHYMIKQEMQSKEKENSSNDSNVEETQTDRQKFMAEQMQGGDVQTKRILSYQNKAPAAPEFHQNPLKVIYSIKTPMSVKSGSRYIPQSPERILDAPDIINDYYLNLMDWSNDNVITVALGNCVYLWNAASGNIEQLVEYEEGDHACSLSWIQVGQILAIGNTSGTVELWDCSKQKRLRVMDGHTMRVGSLAWNSHILTSGGRDGRIIHHDVREREHKIGTLQGHSMEVCGLKWSPDSKYLASGGNDNLVNVWSAVSGGGHTANDPIQSFNEHQAAVRALAWCPWQTNVLATGGGTADRCIKFWNVNNGLCLNSVDSKSQVCALLWSKNYKELVSAHGYANNQLTIWKYPSMVKQAELIGHTARVLQLAMSPDGSTIMSAGADETLRLWNCFTPDPNQAKQTKIVQKDKFSILRQSIR